jgi:hypothetical protein
MIIIYNLSGLLLGVAGAAVGVVVAVATGHLSLGLLATALVWLIFGWRKVDPVTKAKRPYPSVFFIPLAFVAIPLAAVAVPLLVFERVAKSVPRDPRAALLDADEATLRSVKAGGDSALSKSILEGLEGVIEPGAAKVEDYRVFTRVGDDAVLVLVQVPNLKQYQDTAREQLLAMIEGILLAEDRLKDKKVYIGVKGRVAFGAISAPDDLTKTGAAVSERPLYDFYGPAPATTGAATRATSG